MTEKKDSKKVERRKKVLKMELLDKVASRVLLEGKDGLERQEYFLILQKKLKSIEVSWHQRFTVNVHKALRLQSLIKIFTNNQKVLNKRFLLYLQQELEDHLNLCIESGLKLNRKKLAAHEKLS